MTRLNRYRALRAELALRNYNTDEVLATCLIDFLADTRHWCERADESYAELNRKAHEHYLAERAEARRAPRPFALAGVT